MNARRRRVAKEAAAREMGVNSKRIREWCKQKETLASSRRKERLRASGSVEQEEGARCGYGGCAVQLDTGNA